MRLRVVGESGSGGRGTRRVGRLSGFDGAIRDGVGIDFSSCDRGVCCRSEVDGVQVCEQGSRNTRVECAETRCLVSRHNACRRAIQCGSRLDDGRQSQRWERANMREPKMMERERCWFNECLQLVAELARAVFLRLVVAWRGSEKQCRCWGKAGSGQSLADPCCLHQTTSRHISLTGQGRLPLAR